METVGTNRSYADRGTGRSSEDLVQELNSLLRGELSAVATYEQALSKIDDFSERQLLQSFLQEHREALSILRVSILENGGEPAASSGPWGAWAKLVTGTAKLFGDEATIKALIEGEEHGLKEYQEILSNTELRGALRRDIEVKLIPAQSKHISALNSLLRS